LARPRMISDDQILQVARECFLEYGPSGATDVIAERLGVSSQALFKRFHTKQELMLAAVAPSGTPDWIPLVEAGPDDRPLTEQLTEILQKLSDFFVEISRAMSVLRFSGIEPKELLDRYPEAPPLRDIRVLSGWLQRAADRRLIRNLDNRATAMMMLTSMHGPAMLTDMLGQHPTGHSQDEYVSFMVNLLMQGMVPRDTSKRTERE